MQAIYILRPKHISGPISVIMGEKQELKPSKKVGKESNQMANTKQAWRLIYSSMKSS